MSDTVVLLREIKKYFTCYVLLRHQIISTAKITAINEATTDLKKLQVYRLKYKLANFYKSLERRTFHVRQANLSGPTFYFRKTICMTTCGRAKIYKTEFWDDETTHIKQLTSFSPLPKCYVSRGRDGGEFQFLRKKHHLVLFIRFVLYKGLL